jgi:DNA-binding transcriptional ArsR family regulator
MDHIELSIKQIEGKIEKASDFLKIFSNRSRLLVLCNLINGKKTVNDLTLLIGIKQSALSQHLALMRQDKIVSTERSGKFIYYEIMDPSVKKLIEVLYEKFCK